MSKVDLKIAQKIRTIKETNPKLLELVEIYVSGMVAVLTAPRLERPNKATDRQPRRDAASCSTASVDA